MKKIPAKVGTQPWLINIGNRKKLKVGEKLWFREAMPGAKWIEGTIDNVDPLRISL